MITEVQILFYYKQSLKTIIVLEFCDYVNGEVLCQIEKRELLYCVTFFCNDIVT